MTTTTKARKATKAKVHRVELFDREFLIFARTKAGAVHDLFDLLKDDVHVDVASGQQIYEAGRDGAEILNADKFANVVDPAQMELSGVEVDEVGTTYADPRG